MTNESHLVRFWTTMENKNSSLWKTKTVLQDRYRNDFNQNLFKPRVKWLRKRKLCRG
jgi:hypothetical protein